MNILKTLALLNIIGFTILTLALYISITLEPFPWDIMLILANIQLALPFLFFGVLTLFNLDRPRRRTIKISFIVCFLLIWIPTLMLPFATLISGILLSFAVLSVGIYGIFIVKEPVRKMLIFNWLGIFSLAVDAFVVLALLVVNQ